MDRIIVLIIVMLASYYIGNYRGYAQAMRDFKSAEKAIEDL